MREARLILEDGTTFCGRSFGYEADTVGEVVFNTAMMGYPESLTDPSYAGQILVTTYPLIGNYGVPETQSTQSGQSGGLPLFTESDRIHVKGLVVADYSEQYSHWNARESLASWLKREKVPAITGIDTRRLTKMLREHGVMMGRIEFGHTEVTEDTEDYGSVNWVEKVSCKDIINYKPSFNEKDSVSSVFSASSVPISIRPFITPLSLSLLVSLRVSMPVMAGIFSRFSHSANDSLAFQCEYLSL